MFVIEKLTQAHSVAGFECSNATLDTWLKRFAWTNQRAETAKTYVAHRGAHGGDRVVGYHALVAGSVRKHEAPERIGQGIPNHPVGVIVLARLAVDRSEQGKGLGKALLFDALSRIEDAADIVGVRAVLFMPLTRPHGASICTLSLRSRGRSLSVVATLQGSSESNP